MTTYPIPREIFDGATLDGNGRQGCTECQRRSVAGLVRGHGKCPFHWAAGAWGVEWASRCYPTHPAARERIA